LQQLQAILFAQLDFFSDFMLLTSHVYIRAFLFASTHTSTCPHISAVFHFEDQIPFLFKHVSLFVAQKQQPPPRPHLPGGNCFASFFVDQR